MATKSVLKDSKQVERAVALIQLGARLQVLESETDLSYERLLRLYKEVAGKSPSKGQLPFSTDWFMTWQPNIHSSLFLNIHEYLNKVAELDVGGHARVAVVTRLGEGSVAGPDTVLQEGDLVHVSVDGGSIEFFDKHLRPEG